MHVDRHGVGDESALLVTATTSPPAACVGTPPLTPLATWIRVQGTSHDGMQADTQAADDVAVITRTGLVCTTCTQEALQPGMHDWTQAKPKGCTTSEGFDVE